MNCLLCGLEIKEQISFNLSETKLSRSSNKNPSGNFECPKCNIGFHVMSYQLWQPEKSLILKNGKWKTEEKWRLENFEFQ